jgi:hypothetical protein
VADVLIKSLKGAKLEVDEIVREYVPVYDLELEKGLKITVLPRTRDISLAARRSQQHDFVIDVGIQKKLGSRPTQEEIDELMELVERISDLIQEEREYGIAQWIRTENNPIYSPQLLQDNLMFMSVLSCTFRAVST